jgi:hypothetical protein
MSFESIKFLSSNICSPKQREIIVVPKDRQWLILKIQNQQGLPTIPVKYLNYILWLFFEHQFLTCMLSALASVPDEYAEGMRVYKMNIWKIGKLMHMLRCTSDPDSYA